MNQETWARAQRAFFGARNLFRFLLRMARLGGINSALRCRPAASARKIEGADRIFLSAIDRQSIRSGQECPRSYPCHNPVFLRYAPWASCAALILVALFPLINLGQTPALESSGAGPLVRNGDFEMADPVDKSKPANWDKPDGLGIQWVAAPKEAGAEEHGRAIRLNTAISEKAMNDQRQKLGLTEWLIPKPGNNPVAETYGLSYYSTPIPVKPGQTYRLRVDFKGPNGGAKVWVRGWGQFNGEKRRRYEFVLNCRVADNRWTTLSQEFHPTKNRPEVTEMRVMLFAYHPPGIYWFDNVKIEPVANK